MLTTVTHVHLEPFLRAGVQPEVVFDRGVSDCWVVPSGPVAIGDAAPPPEWTIVDGGDLVRVPLFSYTTVAAAAGSLAAVVGFSVEIGVRACLTLPARPRRLHVALGHQVYNVSTDDTVDSYRFFIGFAFELGEGGRPR